MIIFVGDYGYEIGDGRLMKTRNVRTRPWGTSDTPTTTINPTNQILFGYDTVFNIFEEPVCQKTSDNAY